MGPFGPIAFFLLSCERERRPLVGTRWPKASARRIAARSDGMPARERRPLGSPPGGARHSPPEAGAGKDPEFGGGSPLGRDPGVPPPPYRRRSANTFSFSGSSA